jgi:hypothetical protein
MFCNTPNCITRLFFSALLTLGLFSCSKKDQVVTNSATGILTYSLFPGQDKTTINSSGHLISVRVPDSVSSGLNLIATFSVSPGAKAYVDSIYQESGISSNNFENDVEYSVLGGDQSTIQDWKVQATNNDYSIPWGLGHIIKNSSSEDRTYNWYIDQGTSGNDARINCGPASVTMAIKWSDSSFTKTAADARAMYEEGDGWWFTTDIDNYLTNYSIPHAIIGLSDTASVTQAIWTRQLDHQQIIIICLDMNYVRASQVETYRADKFYPTSPGWGHFIVLKGYKKVDGEVFLEAYDPYSFGDVNSDDKSLKGINRFYRAEDLAAATRNWWGFSFVIAKKGDPVNLDAMSRKLNISQVPVAHSSNRNF